MPIPRPSDILQALLQQSGQMPNTPWAQEGINAIMTGNAQKGEELATNLLQSMGMTKEQGMQQVAQVKQQLGNRFPFPR